MYAPVGVGTDQRNIHPSIVFLGCYWDSFVSICFTWTHRNDAPDDSRLHNLFKCYISFLKVRLPRHELVGIGLCAFSQCTFSHRVINRLTQTHDRRQLFAREHWPQKWLFKETYASQNRWFFSVVQGGSFPKMIFPPMVKNCMHVSPNHVQSLLNLRFYLIFSKQIYYIFCQRIP